MSFIHHTRFGRHVRVFRHFFDPKMGCLDEPFGCILLVPTVVLRTLLYTLDMIRSSKLARNDTPVGQSEPAGGGQPSAGATPKMPKSTHMSVRTQSRAKTTIRAMSSEPHPCRYKVSCLVSEKLTRATCQKAHFHPQGRRLRALDRLHRYAKADFVCIFTVDGASAGDRRLLRSRRFVDRHGGSAWCP